MTDQRSHVDQSQTEQELREISHELLMASVLQELALSLPALEDRQQLVAESASSAAMLLDAPRSVVLLLDREGLLLEVAGSYNEIPPGGQWAPVPVGQGMLGQIVTGGRPMLSNAPLTDERYNRHVDGLGQTALSSLLGVPIQTKDRMLGVLVVANRERPFTNRDVRWLTALANIVAGAYQNLRLIDEMRSERERLLEAQEELRRKLARDLHDGATQRIAAVQMELEYMRRILQVQPDQIEREIDIMSEMLTKAMRMLRTALFDLRPLMLETEGLDAALQRYTREHQNDRGPALRLEVSGAIPTLRERVAGALFSIIQEAVTNARKHAGATEIVISLDGQQECLSAEVRDNGSGFNPQDIETNYSLGTSFGMRNMREVVDAIGGTLDVRSEPGKGTSICITVPKS